MLVDDRPAAPRLFAAPLRGAVARIPDRVLVAAGVLAIVLVSLWLRSRALDAKFWIDEGLSVGIAHHDFFSIPSLLREDGSPPLYYLALHVWMHLIGGDGEARTHALSLLFALATIPSGWWAGRRLFGARAGWATAALCATCPFLTYYAQEARMYALVALLGLMSTAAFAVAYVQRDRRALPAFSVLAALMVYAHNWGLFLAIGLGVAFLVLWRTAPETDRRGLLRDGVIGFGVLAVLYLPWVPTLLSQAAHTGAPWSDRPGVDDLFAGLYPLVGGVTTALLVSLLGIAGLLSLRHEGAAAAGPRRAALAIGVALGAAVLLAWLASQVSPAWAGRYFSVFLGPALLLAGAGLMRFGRLGLVALAIVLFLWFDPREHQIRGKSDAYRVARSLDEQGLLAPRDLIVAVHPEHGPLMRYYLGPGYQWADALGFVADNRVFDWRDALERLKDAKPRRTFDRIAPAVAPGHHLILIEPIIKTASWKAPWTSLVRRRAPQWEHAADDDPRFIRVGPVPRFDGHGLPRGVRAIVYLRR
ncbi:MAG TPA: glycosyltransferase family 39 protein [Baekduia sp.]|nr:glycosyltransferase family 39 protein [Baekduia sp.]